MCAATAEERSGEGFTVRDRRGQRADAEPQPSPTASPSHSDRPPAGAGSQEAARPGRGGLPAEADLASLFLMLAHSALVHLGETPDAETGGGSADLAQAKFSIDLLRLLKAKTEGNRTPEESNLLEGILYDLQLRFVEAVRRG